MAEWARSIAPTTNGPTASSRSRCFRRESQAAAGINEPHVVPIHGFGEIDDRLYLDMRLIEGRNLGSLLDGGQSLTPALAVSVTE